MVIFLSGSTFAAIILGVVLTLAGATPSAVALLSFLTDISPIYFVLCGLLSLGVSINCLDDSDVSGGPVAQCVYIAISTLAEFLLGSGTLIVTLTELQVWINTMQTNAIGFILLLPVAIAELLLFLLITTGVGYVISTYLSSIVILKILMSALFFWLCLVSITHYYPTAFSNLFDGTIIGSISSILVV